MEKPMLMRPAEFGKAIQASKSKVYDMLQRGQIPYVRVGGMIRIPAEAIDKLIRDAMAITESGK